MPPRKYTDAKRDGNRKWDAANLDRISIALPKGQKDNTHLQPAGAVAFGALIARELHKLGGEYAAILNYDFPKYLYESDNFGVDTGSEYEVEPQDQPAPKA